MDVNLMTLLAAGNKYPCAHFMMTDSTIFSSNLGPPRDGFCDEKMLEFVIAP
jgi:hypothetical protein